MSRVNEIASVVLVVLLVGATLVCQQSVRQSQQAQATAAVAPPTPTPLPIGPLVVSLNPEVTITSWQYLEPSDPERTLERVPFSPYDEGPDIVQFGGEVGDAMARVREDGVDLMWFHYPWAVQPVVVVDEMTVGIWPNEHIVSIGTSDAINHYVIINWETTIPQGVWHFKLHDGMEIPPVTLQTQ